VTSTTARYDEIADFYDARAGQSVTDPATAALLGLTGEVDGLRLLDLACGQGRVARELAAGAPGSPGWISRQHCWAKLRRLRRDSRLASDTFIPTRPAAGRLTVNCSTVSRAVTGCPISMTLTACSASNTGFRGKVGSNHRRLSTYLNAMIGHGLTLERVAEPPPGADWLRRLPGAAPVPQYLVGRCWRQ
jgi:hypothetical protein